MQFLKTGFCGKIVIIAYAVCVCIITAADYASSVKEFVLFVIPAVGSCHSCSAGHHILNITGSWRSFGTQEIILKSLFCRRFYVYYIKTAVCSIKYNAWPGFAYKNF